MLANRSKMKKTARPGHSAPLNAPASAVRSNPGQERSAVFPCTLLREAEKGADSLLC